MMKLPNSHEPACIAGYFPLLVDESWLTAEDRRQCARSAIPPDKIVQYLTRPELTVLAVLVANPTMSPRYRSLDEQIKNPGALCESMKVCGHGIGRDEMLRELDWRAQVRYYARKIYSAGAPGYYGDALPRTNNHSASSLPYKPTYGSNLF